MTNGLLYLVNSPFVFLILYHFLLANYTFSCGKEMASLAKLRQKEW